MTVATRTRGTPENVAYGLRLSRQRWDDIEVDELSRPVMIVVAAWVVLAWGRFGSQAFVGMRAYSRFVLVGVYGWLGLTAVLWLIARRRSRSSEGGDEHDLGIRRLLIKVGQAHQPLVAGALILQFLQVAPHSVLNTAIGYVMVAWMGPQLVAAVASFERRSILAVVAPTLAAWSLWLATVGWYLEMRLGHLV